MSKHKGETEIIIPKNKNIWPHELLTANALVKAGYSVEFLSTTNRSRSKSPDILMSNKKWEIKSPKSGKLSAVERNIKRALHQSSNIIFDSRRMGRLPDKSIQKELTKRLLLTKRVKSLLFVNRKEEVVDITTMI